MGRWVMGRGLCVMHLRSPYKINTSDIHVNSIYAFSNSTELNYQLSLNFHFTSKFVVLTEKDPKKIHPHCHPRCYPNINRYNYNGAQWLKT